jgi:hypothetical protein
MNYEHNAWILRIKAIGDADAAATHDLLAELGENARSWSLSQEQRRELGQELDAVLSRFGGGAIKASIFSIICVLSPERAVVIANRLLPEVTEELLSLGQLLYQVVNTASLGFELSTTQRNRSALDIDESVLLARKALASRGTDHR